MSQKKPTLGRGLADLLGHTLRPLQPVSVAVPVSGSSGTNGTAPSKPGTAGAPGSGDAASSASATHPGGSANATGTSSDVGKPYGPQGPAANSGSHGATSDSSAASTRGSDPTAQGDAANTGDGHGAVAGNTYSGTSPGQSAGAAPARAPNATSAADAAANANSLAPGEELARLPVDLLQKGKYQPRIDMRQETLQELADSIKAQGVIQPIVVRPIGVPGIGESQRYEIIAGERRWRAAHMAGLTEIPAVIRRIPDEAAIAVALIENIQRENLNPLEEARALERLISEFELTHQEAAEAVGRSRSGVTNLLRLLELAPEVCERVERREIEMGHARAIGSLSNRKQQVEVATLVAKRGLSVRETEALVRRMQAEGATATVPEGQQGGARDPNVLRLEQELADKLGARVAIQHSTAGKGKLVVTYNSLDELDGILAHIQ
jgi:ParB family transcriptional regulator, chromosome partitioning protein